jgi:hypothetical protein
MRTCRCIVHKLLLLIILAPVCIACGSSIMVPTQTIKDAAPDHALVTFIRATSFGGAIDFGIWDSDQLVGVLDPKTYIQYKAAPGEHVFLARAENWSYVKANLEAGKKYYILANVSMGVWKARVVLVPITKDQDKYGQSNIDDWMTRLAPRMPDPAQADAYRNPRIAQVQEAAAKVDDGTTKFSTLQTTDFFE